MNFLFETKYKYKFNSEIDLVRADIRSSLSTPWYDLKSNIGGHIGDDNYFVAEPKFSLGISFLGSIQHLAIITGKLFPKGDHTTVHLTVRPPYIVVLTFYILIILLFIQLFDLNKTDSPDPWLIPVLLGFFLIILVWGINSAKRRIRKRFERTIHIRSID